LCALSPLCAFCTSLRARARILKPTLEAPAQTCFFGWSIQRVSDPGALERRSIRAGRVRGRCARNVEHTVTLSVFHAVWNTAGVRAGGVALIRFFATRTSAHTRIHTTHNLCCTCIQARKSINTLAGKHIQHACRPARKAHIQTITQGRVRSCRVGSTDYY